MGQVTVRHQGELLFESKVGNHTLLVDVPQFAGGHDRGPTGTELLATALGSCMAAVVTLYCRNEGLDSGGMTVEVDYGWGRHPFRLTNLKIQIHLPHVADEQRREAIAEAARHCPVQETLASLGELVVEVVD